MGIKGHGDGADLERARSFDQLIQECLMPPMDAVKIAERDNATSAIRRRRFFPVEFHDGHSVLKSELWSAAFGRRFGLLDGQAGKRRSALASSSPLLAIKQTKAGMERRTPKEATMNCTNRAGYNEY